MSCYYYIISRLHTFHYLMLLKPVWSMLVLGQVPWEINSEMESAGRRLLALMSIPCKGGRKAELGRGRTWAAMRLQHRPQPIFSRALELGWPFGELSQTGSRRLGLCNPHSYSYLSHGGLTGDKLPPEMGLNLGLGKTAPFRGRQFSETETAVGCELLVLGRIWVIHHSIHYNLEQQKGRYSPLSKARLVLVSFQRYCVGH